MSTPDPEAAQLLEERANVLFPLLDALPDGSIPCSFKIEQDQRGAFIVRQSPGSDRLLVLVTGALSARRGLPHHAPHIYPNRPSIPSLLMCARDSSVDSFFLPPGLFVIFALDVFSLMTIHLPWCQIIFLLLSEYVWLSSSRHPCMVDVRAHPSHKPLPTVHSRARHHNPSIRHTRPHHVVSFTRLYAFARPCTFFFILAFLLT